MKHITNLYQKLNTARLVTRASFVLLILALIANSLYTTQSLELTGSLTLLVITLLPLLIFIPGIIREHYKSLSMLCFVTLLYFLVAVTNLFSPTRSSFDIVETVLIVVLFNAAMLFSRWKQYSLYQTSDATKQD